jgi:hypothetical protein
MCTPNPPFNPFAFPNDEKATDSYGMTLMDYFASTAPPPPDWFRPHIEERPKRSARLHEIFGKGSEHPDSELFLRYYNDESNEWEGDNIPPKLKAEVAEADKNLDIWIQKTNEWEAKNNIQTIVQWRFVYATEMLKHRQLITI